MSTQAGASVADQVKLAAEVFLYGYPLVYGMHECASFVSGLGGKFPMHAPYNEFGHARSLAGPEFAFVSPNNDTPYSIAVCDLREGPLVLHVPETADRYYVLQFVDAWTNNFAYVGRRATGTGEGEFLLAPSGYEGDVPPGMRLIQAPTAAFIIVGRIQADGVADLPTVHALQDAFTLTPLSTHQGDGVPATVAGIPGPDPRVSGELEWWERCRVLLKAFPPPAVDAPFLELCRQFGLLEAESPYVDIDPERAAVLVAGAKAGEAKIEELMHQVHASPTGWQSAMHMFDYNLDFFETGTIDSPEWKIGDRTKAYVTRAIVARAGLYGNHGYEAEYGVIWVDENGDQLDGTNRYQLHLETPPPVDGFWSLTMYDVPDFYLVANPIDRYSIGDRTPGLQRGDDGSVTIYMQKDSPGPDKEANWLPTPNGAFRPVMRQYQPRAEILDHTYQLPAITKVA
jgi:hypothetical protein